MSGNSKSIKALLPALGLVFGAGAGIVIALFCEFQIAFGIVFGAAAGLSIGIVFSNLFGDKKQKKRQ